jgi:hypothetical protein
VWINVEEMDWNGRAGNWSGEVELVRGINLLSAEAEEADGDRLYDHHAVIAGEFEDPGRPVAEAPLLRLNQSGIDKLMKLVSDMMPLEDLKAGVLGMELYSGEYLFGAVTLVATVDDLSMGTPTFSAEPGSGELALQAVLPDVYVAIKVVGDVAIFGEFDTFVYLSASPVPSWRRS